MKINTLPIAALLITGLLATSCSKHYYAPALYKNDISYQFKPMSTDDSKSSNNISGSLILGKAYSSDNLTLGQVAYSRANTFQNLNTSYGVYGFAVSYQNGNIKSGDPGYFDNKSISGIGFRGSVNTYVHEGNADLRLFGIEASYSKEFGSYADFRKEAQNLPSFYADGSTSIFTAGLTNETVWRGRNPALQYGYRAFFGAVFGNHQFINNGDPNNTNSPYLTYQKECISGAGFVQINHYQAVFELTNFSTVSLRLGFSF